MLPIPSALRTEFEAYLRSWGAPNAEQGSLAVTEKLSASTQNQAFNALLFFFRHVLNKEFGKIEGVGRAKRKPYIPVVLSRQEIDAILMHLAPPYGLVVKLLYGCGLRLSECLNLRVHCFNFDAGNLTVYSLRIEYFISHHVSGCPPARA